jgi:hypothetical protein
MLNCETVARVTQKMKFPPAANQSKIDSITAELGRHAGDAGETKRLAVLDKKRLSAIACGGAKTRRKKAKPGN